jgi:hypothetical protein
LLGSQNTIRRLTSTFPQIIFPVNVGFTLSLSLSLSPQYKLHSIYGAVRYKEDIKPDKSWNVNLSGKQERKERGIKERKKGEKSEVKKERK